MAKRKPEEKKGSSVPEYMATYGDLVTLLMCFFVLLFAMSTVDADKFKALAASFSSTPRPVDSGSNDTIKELLGSGIMQLPSIKEIKEADSTELSEEVQKAREELSQMAKELTSNFKTYSLNNNLQNQIYVEVMGDHVLIRFEGGLLFDSASAVLRPESLAYLDLIAEEVLQYPDNDIEIIGHTDNLPIGTAIYPSNWHLSSSRAVSVALYLVDQDVSKYAVSPVGKGENFPIASNDTAEGRAQNRRVEIRIKSSYYSEQESE